jgi:hypothetical protein
MNFTLPDGTTEPASVEAGALGCSDGTLHLSENTSKKPRSSWSKFKDRTTFLM